MWVLGLINEIEGEYYKERPHQVYIVYVTYYNEEPRVIYMGMKKKASNREVQRIAANQSQNFE